MNKIIKLVLWFVVIVVVFGFIFVALQKIDKKDSVENQLKKNDNVIGLIPIKKYPFDSSKIEGYNGIKDISKVSGMVKNQIWIYSHPLNQTDIETIVKKYLIFTVVGFDDTLGLLVKFNETDSKLQENIEKLKLEPGVDSINYRYYEGPNIVKDAEYFNIDGEGEILAVKNEILVYLREDVIEAEYQNILNRKSIKYGKALRYYKELRTLQIILNDEEDEINVMESLKKMGGVRDVSLNRIGSYGYDGME